MVQIATGFFRYALYPARRSLMRLGTSLAGPAVADTVTSSQNDYIFNRIKGSLKIHIDAARKNGDRTGLRRSQPTLERVKSLTN